MKHTPDNPTLFAPPHNSTPTSIDAAHAIKPHADTQRAEVLAFIAKRTDGATREEVASGLGMSGDSVRPRVWELMLAGQVVERGTRATASGRRAAVLYAT